MEIINEFHKNMEIKNETKSKDEKEQQKLLLKEKAVRVQPNRLVKRTSSEPKKKDKKS